MRMTAMKTEARWENNSFPAHRLNVTVGND